MKALIPALLVSCLAVYAHAQFDGQGQPPGRSDSDVPSVPPPADVPAPATEPPARAAQSGPATAAAAAADDGTLWVQRVLIANAPMSGHDGATIALAKVLEAAGLGPACVDLRMLGSNSTGDTLEEGTVGALLRSPLGPDKEKAVKKAICQGRQDCAIKLEAQAFRPGSLSLYVYETADPDADESGARSTQRIFALAADKRLPAFSRACQTGRHDDSWLDAAGTPEARRFLVDLGVAIRRVRNLGLLDGAREAWAFGFPNHKKD